MHEAGDAREQLDVLGARVLRGENEEYDAHRNTIRRDVVGHRAGETRGEAQIGQQVGATVGDSETSAHRSAHVGFARMDGSEDAIDGLRARAGKSEANEFAQQIGFGVAAERNANAVRC